MLEGDPCLYFAGFEQNDFHQTLLCAGEREVRDQPRESISSDSEDEVVVRPKMSQVRDCIDSPYNMLMRQMTVTFEVFMNTSTH